MRGVDQAKIREALDDEADQGVFQEAYNTGLDAWQEAKNENGGRLPRNSGAQLTVPMKQEVTMEKAHTLVKIAATTSCKKPNS